LAYGRSSGLGVARNIEIKARVADFDALRARAAALAGTSPHVIQQTDTFFVVPQGRFKVRALADGSGELIAYERRDERGTKESVYTRVGCQDAEALVQIMSRLLPVRGRVVKRRELFLAGRTRIHLDRVAGLGDFLELEVVLSADESIARGRDEAEALVKALAIAPDAHVAEAYIDLLEAAGVTGI